LKVRKNSLIFLFLVLCGIFTSCSTVASVYVLRPARMEMNGADTIGILPFTSYESGRRYGSGVSFWDFFFGYEEYETKDNYDQRQILNYISKELTYGLNNSQYLTLIGSSAIKNAYENNTLSDIVDIYFAGEMKFFRVWDETIYDEKKIEIKDQPPEYEIYYDDDGDIYFEERPKKKYKTVIEEKFRRHIDLSFGYEIIDAKTEKILSYDNVDIKDYSSDYKNPRDLPSPLKMITYELDNMVTDILRDIQPYKVSKSIEFLDIKTKDKQKKEFVKNTKNLVENSDFKNAYENYYQLYSEDGTFEAGYNAAMCLEALGKLYDAQELMEYVCNHSDDSRGVSGLADIKREISLQRTLQNQFDKQEENINSKNKAKEEKLRPVEKNHPESSEKESQINYGNEK
jgi:hypothetical protein